MKKSALTLAALLALSTNVFAAEEVAAASATTGGAAGGAAATGAAIGTTTAVAVGVGAAALAAVVCFLMQMTTPPAPAPALPLRPSKLFDIVIRLPYWQPYFCHFAIIFPMPLSGPVYVFSLRFVLYLWDCYS